jgi:hypothetical protein
MQAIVTKYLGPTNNMPGRIVAKCDAGKVTVSWDHAHDVQSNHELAAAELRKRLDERNGGGSVWACGFVSGSLPDGTYAHVYRGEE